MRHLSPIVSNRAQGGSFELPADDWYQLVPLGEYPHPESGLLQVIDEPALRQIVNRFTVDSQQTNFPGLRIDYEHFSYDADKLSTAAGWIMAMQNRAEGLWAQIKWSADGEKDVKGGNYRFVSPVWLPGDLQQLGNRRVRPLRLDSAGLTNNPNLRGMVPLSNRSTSPGGDTSQDAADNTKNPPIPNRMKSLCSALGLSADASEEAALAEVTKLKNRAATAEQALEPGKTRVKDLETANSELKNRNRELLTNIVDQDLEHYANRFKPEAKDRWKAQLLANRAATIELLETLPDPADESGRETSTETKAIHNRAQTKTPEGNALADVEKKKHEKDRVRAKKIANRAQLIAKEQNIAFTAAWKKAEAELPAE